MEIAGGKLEDLIGKVEKEAVDKARAKSEEILAQARKEVETILAGAREEAEGIVRQGERQAEQVRKSGEEALRQAARDIQLLLGERIGELFDSVFRRQVALALEGDFLKELVLTIARGWSGRGPLEFQLNPEDAERLEALLVAGVREELREGIEIRANERISAGFHVSLKGEDSYYDFTEESIAAALREFVNPRLRQILSHRG